LQLKNPAASRSHPNEFGKLRGASGYLTGLFRADWKREGSRVGGSIEPQAAFQEVPAPGRYHLELFCGVLADVVLDHDPDRLRRSMIFSGTDVDGLRKNHLNREALLAAMGAYSDAQAKLDTATKDEWPSAFLAVRMARLEL
jgi:hypothetical protein